MCPDPLRPTIHMCKWRVSLPGRGCQERGASSLLPLCLEGPPEAAGWRGPHPWATAWRRGLHRGHPSERLSQERRAVGGENLEVGFLVPLESWREFIQGGRECMKRLWVSQAERVPAEGSWVRRPGVRPGSGVGALPELGVGACSASRQGDARGRMPGVALWPCEVPGRGQERPAGLARAVCHRAGARWRGVGNVSSPPVCTDTPRTPARAQPHLVSQPCPPGLVALWDPRPL